ncbi:ABC transporter permease [Agriterribacter sp.]|uniref:ABC transporter permease n=1 Tax=Agriterribacter sp. TaxID=2821509 RepID=UPI002CC2D5A8|nr:ABC transporter permease [Agriterribacter sp.]HRO44582.1 ABC transporter permease [Agriterribacter sp.]HRQ16019.1 ABC transporter permease [Agriterribacter sp.]
MAEELIIEAGKAEKNYWKDLWRYRELFYILSLRDIKVRYKQTVLGVLWSVLRPLITMIVFTLIFSKVAKLPAAGSAPYAIMVYVGMLPWQFFANAISEASNSLIGNTNLISKVYFPRLIIPTASVITSMIDFLIAFFLMLLLCLFYQYLPGWQIIFLPLFLLLAFTLAIGIGLWITALNVKYRDFRYIVPFIVQFGLYVSPVGFSTSVIPEKYRLLFYLNPMVGVIDGFRWSLLNGEPALNVESLLISVLISLLFLWMGITKFRKMEKSFADII